MFTVQELTVWKEKNKKTFFSFQSMPNL